MADEETLEEKEGEYEIYDDVIDISNDPLSDKRFGFGDGKKRRYRDVDGKKYQYRDIDTSLIDQKHFKPVDYDFPKKEKKLTIPELLDIVHDFREQQYDKGVDDTVHINVTISKNGKNAFVFVPEIHTEYDIIADKFLRKIEDEYSKSNIIFIIERNEKNNPRKNVGFSGTQSLALNTNFFIDSEKVTSGDVRKNIPDVIDLDVLEKKLGLSAVEKFLKYYTDIYLYFYVFYIEKNKVFKEDPKTLYKNVMKASGNDDDFGFDVSFALKRGFLRMLKEFSELYSKIPDSNFKKYIKSSLGEQVLKSDLAKLSFEEYQDPKKKDNGISPLLRTTSIINDGIVMMNLAKYIENYSGEESQIVIFVYGSAHTKYIRRLILKKQEDNAKGFGLIGLSREMMYKKRKTK